MFKPKDSQPFCFVSLSGREPCHLSVCFGAQHGPSDGFPKPWHQVLSFPLIVDRMNAVLGLRLLEFFMIVCEGEISVLRRQSLIPSSDLGRLFSGFLVSACSGILPGLEPWILGFYDLCFWLLFCITGIHLHVGTSVLIHWFMLWSPRPLLIGAWNTDDTLSDCLTDLTESVEWKSGLNLKRLSFILTSLVQNSRLIGFFFFRPWRWSIILWGMVLLLENLSVCL